MMTSSPRPSVEEVEELVNQFLKAGYQVRAMSLIFCLSRLHCLDSQPDEAVVAIRNCSSRIDDIIRPMTKSKSNKRFVDFGMIFMDDIIRDLRNVAKATPGIKADMEARCLCDIGLSSRAARQTDKALASFKLGIKVMTKQFGLNAIKFQIFGHLSNNIAIVYRMREQYGKAMIHYEKSLEAYGKAQDWEGDFIKNKRLQSTRVNLALLKRKMNN